MFVGDLVNWFELLRRKRKDSTVDYTVLGAPKSSTRPKSYQTVALLITGLISLPGICIDSTLVMLRTVASTALSCLSTLESAQQGGKSRSTRVKHLSLSLTPESTKT